MSSSNKKHLNVSVIKKGVFKRVYFQLSKHRQCRLDDSLYIQLSSIGMHFNKERGTFLKLRTNTMSTKFIFMKYKYTYMYLKKLEIVEASLRDECIIKPYHNFFNVHRSTKMSITYKNCSCKH